MQQHCSENEQYKLQVDKTSVSWSASTRVPTQNLYKKHLVLHSYQKQTTENAFLRRRRLSKPGRDCGRRVLPVIVSIPDPDRSNGTGSMLALLSSARVSTEEFRPLVQLLAYLQQVSWCSSSSHSHSLPIRIAAYRINACNNVHNYINLHVSGQPPHCICNMNNRWFHYTAMRSCLQVHLRDIL